MMRAVAQRVRPKRRAISACDAPVTLGITVLTSMDDGRPGQPRALSARWPEQVLELAGQARAAGLSGVVASPQEAKALREKLGPDAYIVTPGVRPKGTALDDQKRVATPREAIDNGASHIVVGRPITKADDPVAAFEAIVASLE